MEGEEAVQMAESLRPDVILMDVSLRGSRNGIEAARAIQAAIETSIIYVSAYTERSLVNDAVRSGAAAYIVKPFQVPQVTSSIEIALHQRNAARPAPTPDTLDEGESPAFTPMLRRLQQLLLDEDAWSGASSSSNGASKASLCVTRREKDVIRGLVCYRRLAKVAEVLGISVHTARNHLKSVFRKLDLHSQDELLRFLLEG
jgi:DNA-binding NarL/FixJ family response regulator